MKSEEDVLVSLDKDFRFSAMECRGERCLMLFLLEIRRQIKDEGCVMKMLILTLHTKGDFAKDQNCYMYSVRACD
jgi:hypothetical protein